MVERSVLVTNEAGLHARPAALFVQTAGKFAAKIWIVKDDRVVNAKSIMSLMSLTVSSNHVITIRAEGEDEDLAVRDLVELVASGFRE